MILPSLVAAALSSAAPATPDAGAGSIEAEAREVLQQLLTTNTSHGHETEALRPLVTRFAAAGVTAQIVESAPGRGNLVARLKGNGSKKPLLLLAHVDVVPVEGQPWTTDPFKPVERDGQLVARGVGDDKSMAAAIVAIALNLARRHEPLSRDVIVALTAGEETGGGAGARWLAESHRELIDAELALNEGGVLQLAPDEGRMEQVFFTPAEKTFQSFDLVVKGKGGHSSIPPPDLDPVTILAKALQRVGEHAFPAKVLPSTRAWLAASAKTERPPLSTALAHVAAANAVSPADDRILSRDRLYRASVHTTCVATMLSAAPQDNVLPTTAKATVNCRILPDETPERTQATLVRVIGDARVEVTPVADFGFAPPSPVEGEVPSALGRVTRRLWGEVPVVAGMTLGATDSRFLRKVGIRAYGIAAAPQTLENARSNHGAHGPDEQRPVRWLPAGVQFLQALTVELAR